MDIVEGVTTLLERTAPRLVLPVASALLVTLLWLLTGWGWFDVGPWPWALGLVPLVAVQTVRLAGASQRHHAATDALIEVVGSARSAGRALVVAGGDARPLAGVVRLARSRLGAGGASADLAGILDAEHLALARGASEPTAALIGTVRRQARARAVDLEPALMRLEAALARCDAHVPASVPLEPASALALLWLSTLPVGLVTTTGWWTFLAVAGVALAVTTLDALAEALERPFTPGGLRVDIDTAALAAERELATADTVPTDVAGSSD